MKAGLKVNGKDIKNYNTYLSERININELLQEFDVKPVSGRLIGSFSKKREITKGQATVTLNGIFNTQAEFKGFEDEILSVIRSQPFVLLEFEYLPGVIYRAIKTGIQVHNQVGNGDFTFTDKYVVQYVIDFELLLKTRIIQPSISTDSKVWTLNPNRVYTMEFSGRVNLDYDGGLPIPYVELITKGVKIQLIARGYDLRLWDSYPAPSYTYFNNTHGIYRFDPFINRVFFKPDDGVERVLGHIVPVDNTGGVHDLQITDTDSLIIFEDGRDFTLWEVL